MALTAIVTPSDDILIDGCNLYSFTASSAVSGGALVKPVGEYSVGHATALCDNVVGVALDEVAKGELVTVAGPGCIVRCCASSAVSYGDDLYAAQIGTVHAGGPYGGTAGCVGIALETQSTANGAVRVLLK